MRGPLLELLTRLFRPSKHYAAKIRAELRAAEARIGAKIAALGHEAALLTRARLDEAVPAPGRLAVISPLPPARTGVAQASVRTFAAWPAGVDYFDDFRAIADMNLLQFGAALGGWRHRALHVDFLPEVLARGRYAAAVFAFGNSAHNVATLSWLLRIRQIHPRPPIIIQVHDPIVLDVLRRVMLVLGYERDELFARAYDGEALALWRSGAWRDLIDRGVCGMRAIRRAAPIDAVIVNSRAARQILVDDDPLQPDARIETLFLPVMTSRSHRPAPRLEAARPPDELRVGFFGVMDASKRPDVALEAVRILRRRGRPVRLVIAGYDVRTFAAAHALEAEDFIELHQNPDDQDLTDLMASVDVAVQLRDRNGGESSGAVSMLIGLGTPTIVSRLGSFEEFGDAVAFVSPGCGPAALADQIIATHADADGYRARALRLAAQRSPQRFCAELARLVGELNSRAVPLAR